MSRHGTMAGMPTARAGSRSGMRRQAEPAPPCAARHRLRAATRADRGQPPVGGAPAADLRSRSPRVPGLPRRHAHRRVHHALVGHRPDPHPPPDPRRPRVERRAAEPPIDAGPREPGRVTRPAPVRRHHDLRVRTAPPTPRDQAGTFGVRGGPTAAAPRAPPAPGPPPGPQPEQPARHTGAVAVAPKPAHQRSRGRGPGRILPPPRLNFLSRRRVRPPRSASACGRQRHRPFR